MRMTLTLSVCHAWGNPTLTLRSAGLPSLREFQSCLSTLTDSFLSREQLRSQRPVRKKQRGRGFDQLEKRELTLAQCPHASPSPQREHSPVLFTLHDQRSSVAVSDMISFGVSDNELDDSLSPRCVNVGNDYGKTR